MLVEPLEEQDREALTKLIARHILEGSDESAIFVLDRLREPVLSAKNCLEISQLKLNIDVLDALKNYVERCDCWSDTDDLQEIASLGALTEQLKLNRLQNELDARVKNLEPKNLQDAKTIMEAFGPNLGKHIDVRRFAINSFTVLEHSSVELTEYLECAWRYLKAEPLKIIFETAIPKVITEFEDPHKIVPLLTKALSADAVKKDQAVARLMHLADGAEENEMLLILGALFEMDETQANQVLRSCLDEAKHITSIGLLRSMIEMHSTQLDESNFRVLFEAARRKRIWDDKKCAINSLQRVSELISSGNYTSEHIEFVFEILSLHSSNSALLQFILTNGTAWKLWEIEGIEDRFDIAVEHLEPNKITFVTALFRVLLGDRYGAKKLLRKIDLESSGELAPLVNWMNVSCSLFRVDREPHTFESKDPLLPKLGFELCESIPPAGGEVLVICQPGADPSAALSINDQGYAITYCPMDSWKGRFTDAPQEYWSLRDMCLDADPLSRQITYAVREFSEAVISHYANVQASIIQSEKKSLYNNCLSVALEDALEGTATVAACMLRAIQKFDGAHVVLIFKDARAFLEFEENFHVSGKTVYVGFDDRKSPNMLDAAKLWGEGSTLQEYFHEAKSVNKKKVENYFTKKAELSFADFIEKQPAIDGDAVAVMSAFSDPIYSENIIPIIDGLLDEYDVYVIEPLVPQACLRELKAAFGENFERTKGRRLILVDFSGELSSAQRMMTKLASDVYERIVYDVVSSKNLGGYNVGGMELGSYFANGAAARLRKAVLRFSLCAVFYEELFERFQFNALYVCSERLPVRMTAVAAANKFGIKTIDVMAVNSVRLPRYRPPQSSILSSIDTITSEFFIDFFGTPSSNVALTGSPRMDLILSKIKSSNVDQTLERLGATSGEKIILYACQLQPIDRCISILKNLLKVVEDNQNAVLVVKLHRRENFAREKAYREVAAQSSCFERVRLIRDEPYLSDIVHVLKASNVVVSMYSNALREAACIGVPFVAANYFDTPLPFEYHSSGIGVNADSEEKLISAVGDFVQNGPSVVYTGSCEKFFADNKQLVDHTSVERIVALARE